MNKIKEYINDYIETERKFARLSEEIEAERKFLKERYENSILQRIRDSKVSKFDNKSLEIELVSDKNDRFILDKSGCEFIKKFAIEELKFYPEVKCSIDTVHEKTIYKIKLSE